jgi:hypothetical protein
MTDSKGRQFVILRVPNVVDEADFFARIYNSVATEVNDSVRQVDTGAFIMRIEKAENPADHSTGVIFEITVNNVNRFTEEVWNRGVKYVSRPQNHRDGFRRVGFMSPADIRVNGVGPLKSDSTGAFTPLKPADE